MIKLTDEQAKELWLDEATEVDGIEYVQHEQTEFIDEGKWSSAEVIFSKEGRGDGPFYSMSVGRSGSYYGDYHYEFETDCPEVVKKAVTKYEWVVKK